MHSKGASKLERFSWKHSKINKQLDWVAEESPVAFMYNCISHVVMMATPADLTDFAVGFSLSEGIVERQEDILDIEIANEKGGKVLSLMVPEAAFNKLKSMRRNISGRSGCGICGAETIEQAVRQPSVVGETVSISNDAIQRALGEFTSKQEINQATGAVHAACWCDEKGRVVLLREDVGRHNALDKLLGAIVQAKLTRKGFVVVTSRASYEMVLKAANLGVEMLVAVSAPTTLAIQYAQKANLTLVAFGREGTHAIYSGAQRMVDRAEE